MNEQTRQEEIAVAKRQIAAAEARIKYHEENERERRKPRTKGVWSGDVLGPTGPRLIERERKFIRKVKAHLDWLEHPPKEQSREEWLTDVIARIDNIKHQSRADYRKLRQRYQAELDSLQGG